MKDAVMSAFPVKGKKKKKKSKHGTSLMLSHL